MIKVLLQFALPALLTAIGAVIVSIQPNIRRRKLKKRTFLNGWEMRGIRNERIKISLDFCEDKITEIEIQMKNRYSKLLESLKIDRKEQIEEMRKYSNCIEKALRVRCVCFRYDVRENHFHTRTQKEHDEYVSNKTEAHLSGVSKEIGDMYYSKYITRETLAEFSSPLLKEIDATIREVYDFAREASSSAAERAKKILEYENVTDSSEKEWWINKI